MFVESFSGLSPLGLAIIFYCLRFQTSHFVASYDSQGRSGGIRHHLHTGDSPKLIKKFRAIYGTQDPASVPYRRTNGFQNRQ
jgi:hypothetical protein